VARIDHLVLGVADLDTGVAWVRDRLGVAPVPGGAHDGLGTRNALLGLGPEQYLEVIALDPEQGVVPELGFAPQIVDLASPALLTVCVRLPHIDDGIAMSRLRPDGVRLEWVLRFTDTPLFFIDWRDSEHPSIGLPDGGRITSVTITTPDVASLSGVEDVEVHAGPWRVAAAVNGVALA
jgi:hypothetical protein